MQWASRVVTSGMAMCAALWYCCARREVRQIWNYLWPILVHEWPARKALIDTDLKCHRKRLQLPESNNWICISAYINGNCLRSRLLLAEIVCASLIWKAIWDPAGFDRLTRADYTFSTSLLTWPADHTHSTQQTSVILLVLKSNQLPLWRF